MSYGGANDHQNPHGPDDPLYYAPRSARGVADSRSTATPQMRAEHLPAFPPLSRSDEMREQAFAKFNRPLESRFVDERGRSRGRLGVAAAVAAAIGMTVVLGLVLFNVLPRSNTDPAELAVSISTPALATPAPPAKSDDSQALLQGFQRFQGAQGGEDAKRIASEPASVGTVKEGAEKPQALLDKFIQWEQTK
jgi:hypothetical protein